MYDENAGVARLRIRTNMPERFTDATGALFYTDDGTATGGGGMHTCVETPCSGCVSGHGQHLQLPSFEYNVWALSWH